MAANSPLRETRNTQWAGSARPPLCRAFAAVEGEKKILRKSVRAGSTDGADGNPGRADQVRKRAYLHGARI